MAYTQAQLAALQAALASGALVVEYEDRSIRYRSVEELIAAIAIVQGALDEAAGTARHNRSFATFSKG